MNTSIPASANITIHVNLDDIFRTVYGDETYEKLPDALLSELARESVKKLAEDKDGYRSLRQKIDTARDSVVREIVTPIVEEALTTNIQLTNRYGEPTGQTATLRELVLAEASRVTGMSSGSYRANNQKETKIQELIRTEIARAFESELKSVIEEAKAEVRSAVQAKGAEVLAKTIQEMAGVK